MIPVIEALARRVDVPISIDTYKASTADAASPPAPPSSTTSAACGMSRSWPMSSARRGAAIILMHTRGRSRDMYQQASYGDVVAEVLDELRESMAFATGAGIAKGTHPRRSGSGIREGGASQFRGARASRRVRRARMPAGRRTVEEVIPGAAARRHRAGHVA